MSDTSAIVRDEVTGTFGFRMELGHDGNGARMQARRSGFVTEKGCEEGVRPVVPAA